MKNNYPRFYIGPMSKNIVDSIIEYTNKNNFKVGLIPSRRQIEFDRGYVNNWSTEEFSFYVKLNSKKILLQRDHAGPDQGRTLDDGYESLKKDCFNFDLIHIDPWKKFPDYTQGLGETIKMIKFCDSLNPLLRYEVGTEESIRKFEVEELENFIIDLSYGLGQELFNKIIYLVIQSGTSLKETTQTGNYNKDRLVKMIELCKKYKLLSKEHNGDYISKELIKEKFKLGLNAINIAPEFGLTETQCYLELIEELDDKDEALDIWIDFYNICKNSEKWVKWVNKDFNPDENKLKTIHICGHYVLSSSEFIEKIRSKFTGENIDRLIKFKIKSKLKELHGIIS